MGLAITAYSKLTPVGHLVLPWCGEGGHGHIDVFAYDAFPQSFRGIEVVGTEPGFLRGGCYQPTDKTERHSFAAGSYSSYNGWRDDLQQQFNPDLQPDAPFYELIWFADNEGAIGPEAATDLLVDFQRHHDQYSPSAEWASYYRQVYADFARAVELAASGGLVEFR